MVCSSIKLGGLIFEEMSSSSSQKKILDFLMMIIHVVIWLHSRKVISMP